jgi:uncharacterized repeat protein (TIGR01451 family)/CSLREA domain-containing protein
MKTYLRVAVLLVALALMVLSSGLVSGSSEPKTIGAAPPSAQQNIASRLVPATATFTVNSTGDTPDNMPGDGLCNDGMGNCTLRAAMMEAEALGGTDTINFDITGPKTITPVGALPVITNTVIINGTTQPGFSGTPIIELRGGTIGAAVILDITASNCFIRGLVINNVDGDAIRLKGNGNSVLGNFIGTDLTGAAPGPGAAVAGISIQGTGNIIGGTGAGEANIIGFSGRGVNVISGVNNLILANSIFSNTTLGIDLNNDVVTANDPCDGDSGPNGLKNYPALTGAQSNGSFVAIQGTFNSVASTTYQIDFYANPACHSSGFGEGQTFIGSASVTTDSTCNATFSASFAVSVPVGQVITATATDPSANTSEFSQCVTVGMGTFSDLQITQSDSPDPVLTGANITYTIAVTNNGPATDFGSSFSDMVPAGTTFVSLTSPGSCSTPPVGGTGTVTCSLGALFPGSPVTMTLVVKVTAVPGSTITNTASTTGMSIDPNLDNNSATATTTVTGGPVSDLQITNSDSPDPVLTGANITYTIAVTNNGPDTDAGATFSAAVPAGTTFVSLISPGGCSTPPVGGTGTVTCSLGALFPASSVTMTLVVKVTAAPGSTITNTASVSGMSSDPSLGNNSATATTAVSGGPVSDLQITNSDSPDPVLTGANITYTIAVTNNGPDTDAGATFSDTVPAGTTFVSFTSSGSCSTPPVGGTGTVTCSLGALLTSGSTTMTLVVKVTAAPGSTITNTASITGMSSDPSLGNNSATATTTVAGVPVSDLQITNSDSPDPVLTGSNITYTIAVTNNGPDTDAGASFSDTLPAGTTFVSLTSPGSCSTPAVGGTGTVSCSLGALSTGGSATITLVVNVNAAPGSTITNTASISGMSSDPNLANNSATATTTVSGVSDLQVTKSDSPDPVLTGSNITYTIVVKNNGPDAETGASFSDTLPAGTTFVSLTSPGSCSTPAVGGTGTVSCSLGALAAGASATITLVVNVNAAPGSTITNTASVSGMLSDPSPGNNSATANTTVLIVCMLTCPASLIRNTDPNQCGAVVTYQQPGASGPCGTVTCSPASGSFFPKGTTNVTCSTAAITCSFDITVVDNIPPQITCPADIIVPTDPGMGVAVGNYAFATFTDNCPGANAVCLPPSGTVFPLGVSTVTCSAKDVAGNNAACAFTVTVIDAEAPQIRCPVNVAIVPPPGQTSAVVNYAAPTVSDNLPGATAACSPLSGSSFPTGITTVICTAADARGNRASCSFLVTVGGPQAKVTIPGNKAAIELATVNPARKPPKPKKNPCTLFAVENVGFAPLVLTFDSIKRTGADVTSGRISDPNDLNAVAEIAPTKFFSLFLVNSDQSLTQLSPNAVLTLQPGQAQTLCIKFAALIPGLAGKTTGLAASDVLPDLVTSTIAFRQNAGANIAIPVLARVATGVVLINPANPRGAPVVNFTRSGNDITVSYAVFDSNLDVSRAKYEFLNANGQVVAGPFEIDLAEPLRALNLTRGQSFSVEQRFTGASSSSDITAVRVTVFDAETSAIGSSSSATPIRVSSIQLMKRARGVTLYPPDVKIGPPFP